MEKLKISTIFYSIQGEATHSGEASIFIRLYGCNLDCSFCDDLLHNDKSTITMYSYEEVLKEIKKFNSNKIIITGGEPSIYELNNFIEFLQNNKYFVSIETNGYKLENIQKANWITYSPKDWGNIHNSGFSELKFIVNTSSKIDKILQVKTNKQIYIQPENNLHTINTKNMQYCIQLVLKYPHLLLSVQLHKFLGVL